MLEYTGIRVRDLARSERFYTEGLGLVRIHERRGAAGGRTVLLRDPESGARLELNHYPDDPPFREGDELDHLAFRSEALESTVSRLRALGGKTRIPAHAEEGVQVAFVSDPDGIWIKLFHPTASDDPPTSRAME
ncbi:MAG TPA: VOC family protein [Thermoplasmata archaeon]|nr:VOC family protein [Thermoplasmata archaeon]